jgi:mannosyltransferase OCH1-like enzyme
MDKKIKIILFVLFSLVLISLVIFVVWNILNMYKTIDFYEPPKEYEILYNIIVNKISEPLEINVTQDDNESFPKNIFRTWCKSNHKVMCGGRKIHPDILNITKQTLYDWKEKIYSDKDIDEFLDKEFGKNNRITKAYYLINKKYGAARADLFRYLVIYKYGGLYLDMKSCVRSYLPHIPKNKDMWVSGWGSPQQSHIFPEVGEYQNWYIYCRKGAPIMKDIIEKVVDNIYYLHENPIQTYNLVIDDTFPISKSIVLSTTGPIAMTLAINTSEHKNTVYVDNSINTYLYYNYYPYYSKITTKDHYSSILEPLITIKENSSYIPKVVYMTYYVLEAIPQYVKDNINKYCSGYDIKIFDDDMCIDFLYKYYGENAVEIFKKMKLGAHKACFWKYCILYIFGGYYFDIKINFQTHIDDIFNVNNDKTFYTVIDNSKNRIFNGIIVTPPRNPIILKAIYDIYENSNPPTYTYYIESFFSILQNNCSQNLSIGINNLDNDWKCILFQEEKINCKTDCDRYGGKYIIKNEKGKVVLITRYNDFPWKVEDDLNLDKKNKVKIYNKKYQFTKTIYNIIIPLVVYQTWYTKDLPLTMKNNVDNLKNQNPEFKFFLYDDDENRDFIKDNFNEEILEAYDTLIPGAYKADLWRLCMLFINGGFYIDIKLNCINNFKLIELSEKCHFVKDRPANTIYNAFIVCEKGNNLVKKGIRKIVENVNNEYRGSCSLSPTGPKMLGEIMNINNTNIDMCFFKYGGYIIYKDTFVISTEYPEYDQDRKIMNKKINKDHYSVMWYKNNIYKKKGQTYINSKFDEVYSKKFWNSEMYGTLSGIGSSKEINKYRINFLYDFIEQNNIKNIIDICGDCAWQGELMSRFNINVRYHGFDASKIAIEQAKKNNSKAKNMFFYPAIDLCKYSINNFDSPSLVIIKEVIQHLPLENSISLLDKLKNSGIDYIAISHHDPKIFKESENKNINVGEFYHNNIYEKPFKFKNPLYDINNYLTDDDTKKHYGNLIIFNLQEQTFIQKNTKENYDDYNGTDGSAKLYKIDDYTRYPLDGYKIPQNIFQTHETNKVPIGMYNSIKSIQKHALSCSYTFYDKKQRREYILNNYPVALPAYDMLVTETYQSNLFRYIRLYVEGGIYFDTPFNTNQNIEILKDVIDHESEFISAYDNHSSSSTEISILYGFIATIPNHPILKEVIDISIVNIMNKIHLKEPNGFLTITGHLVLGKESSTSGHIVNKEHNYPFVKLYMFSTNLIKDGDKIIYNTRYPEYDQDIILFEKKP